MKGKEEKSWIDRIDAGYIPWIGVGIAAGLSIIGILMFL